MSEWVWIVDWTRFQHYKNRNPPWIKNYVELLSDEDYLDLTSHRRGLLHGLWMSFATSRGRLRADTRTLSSRLRMKVTSRDLDALCHAGFIEILASAPLAERLQAASTLLALARADAGSREVEVEKEEEQHQPDVRLDKNNKPAHVWQDTDEPIEVPF